MDKFKFLIIFLIFSSLLFSEVYRESSISNEIFYMPQSVESSPYKITTGLYFKNTFTLSTSNDNLISGDYSDLSNGDIICPGSITIKSDVSGKFANNNQWNSILYVPSTYTDVNDPDNYASWSGTISSKSILFSSSKYNNLDVSHGVIQSTSHSLWNDWPAENNLKISQLYLWGNSGYYAVDNLKGKFSAICKSSINIYKNNSLIFSNLNIEDGEISKTIELAKGSYSFKSGLSVSGCGISFHPVYSSNIDSAHDYKLLFSRTSADNGPEYSYSQSATPLIYLEVRDPIFKIGYAPSSIVDNDGNEICFSEKFNTKNIKVKIKNEGDVDLKLTGYKITNAGFTAWTLLGVDGFECTGLGGNIYEGCSIPKGTEKTVSFLVTYDKTSAIPTSLNLKLDYDATKTICNVEQGDSGSTNVLIPNSECDDTGGYYCIITPSSQSQMNPNLIYSFNVKYYNSENQEVTCADNKWSIIPSNWGLFGTGDVAIVRPSGNEGYATLFSEAKCENKYDIKCGAALSSTSDSDDPPDFYAVIDPDENLDMTVGIGEEFQLYCFQKIDGQHPNVISRECINPSWDPPGNIFNSWTVNPSSGNIITILTPTYEYGCNPNPVHLKATTGISGSVISNHYAYADVCAKEQSNEIKCKIIPEEQMNMAQDQAYPFSVEFYDSKDNTVQCNNIQWDLTPSNWVLGSSTGIQTTAIATAQGYGALFAQGICNQSIVRCGAPLSTYSIIPEYFSIIDPSEKLDMEVGTPDEFILYCYERLDDYPWLSSVECQNIVWHPPNENGVFWNANPLTGDIQTMITPTYPGEGELSATSSHNNFEMEAFSYLFAIDKDSCIISWENPQQVLKPGTEATAQIVCRYQGNEVDCVNVDWQVQGAKILSSTNSDCNLMVLEESESIKVNADVPLYNLTCFLDGNSGIGKGCSIDFISFGNKYGQFEFNATCKDGNSEIDCVYLLSDLGQSDFIWDVQIKDEITGESMPSTSFILKNGDSGEYSKIVEIFNYFLISQGKEYTLKIEAEAEDLGSEGIGDISCEKEMPLPDILCQLFI